MINNINNTICTPYSPNFKGKGVNESRKMGNVSLLVPGTCQKTIKELKKIPEIARCLNALKFCERKFTLSIDKIFQYKIDFTLTKNKNDIRSFTDVHKDNFRTTVAAAINDGEKAGHVIKPLKTSLKKRSFYTNYS